MIRGIADEAHSLSYVTNRQAAKQLGETHRCKGYFYTAPYPNLFVFLGLESLFLFILYYPKKRLYCPSI
jgi:hypothetical protein